MPNRIELAGLQIDAALHSLLTQEIAPGTGVDPEAFWQGLADIWAELGPENKRLLKQRDDLQAQINQWHRDHHNESWDAEKYEAFLREISYLQPSPPAFSITTENVDPEIAHIAGPQLVVPVMNARYALNAANARWGSLYDALYGTDVIPEEGGAEVRKPRRPEAVQRQQRRAEARQHARQEDVVSERSVCPKQEQHARVAASRQHGRREAGQLMRRR